MKRTMTMFLTLSFSLLVAGAAQAEPWGPRGQTPERMERFKAKRGELLRQKVGLAEAQAVKVEAIMDRYQVERQDLRVQARDAKQAIKTLLAEDSNDQRAYQNELDVLQAVRKSMHELHDAEIAELRAFLTPKESTKLLVMMEQVHKRMRGMRGGKGRFGPRNGSGDGPRDGSGSGPGFGGPGFGF